MPSEGVSVSESAAATKVQAISRGRKDRTKVSKASHSILAGDTVPYRVRPKAMSSMTMAEFVKSLKKPTVACLCGSSRAGSFNARLLQVAVQCLEGQGATCDVIDLDNLSLPLYSTGCEETSFPDAAKELKRRLVAADAIVVTCPEFNGMPTPLLLNAITWATRGEGPMYAGFKGKISSVMSTSPGPMGGARVVLGVLQRMFADMGSVVVPGHVAIGGSMKVFPPEGGVDEKAKAKIEAECGQLVHFARFEANRAADDLVKAEIQKQTCIGEYGSVWTHD